MPGGQSDKRRLPRAAVALPCTLRRQVGRPILAETVNVGAGGMLVASARPLAIDEPLEFDLDELEIPVCGHARVLRHQQLDLFALGFENLPPEMSSCLQALATD